MEEYMAAVEAKGAEYGLQIHWGKVVLLPVCARGKVHAPDGSQLEPSDSMVYCASVHAGGKFSQEVARKLGKATAEFKALTAVWKHASVPLSR